MKETIFSIVVTTYNQQDTLVETLESIKAQTYKPIELIISDDCSTDNTLNIADKWLSENKERFVNTKIVKTPLNSGISANVSNGLKNANGEFLKYMAGDDLLLQDAIESMSDFLNQNKNARFCISKIQELYTYEGKRLYGFTYPDKNKEKNFLKLNTTDKQFKMLYNGTISPAVGSFFRKSVFEEKGYPDEDIKWTDDYGIWLKLNRNGELLFYLPKLTAYWRRHLNSTSMRNFFKVQGIQCDLEIKYRYVVPYINLLSVYELLDLIAQIVYSQNIIKYGGGYESSKKARWIRLISPKFYVNRPKVIINKIRYANIIRIYKKMRV